MKKSRVLNYLFSFFVFAALIAIDQITKVLAVEHLKGKPPVDIIKDVLQLTYVQNTGAAWAFLMQLFLQIFWYLLLRNLQFQRHLVLVQSPAVRCQVK